ncbi:MAG: MoaD family protein [Pyrobaculum sp.]
MRVLLKYFSALRDVTGKVSEEVEVSDGTTLSTLLAWFFNKYPNAKVFKEELLVLVNGKAVDDSYILKEGDEVAVMPPVSGGGVVEGPIDVNKVVAEIIEKSAPLGGGGLVIFIGFVKGRVGDAYVSMLEYEAYEPYASKKLEEIEEWAKRQEGVLEVKLFHRVGTLRPGDTTIYIFVSALNRDTAFRVAREALEKAKHEVPIFKLERRNDGEFWVVGDGKRIPRSPQS